MAAPPLRQFGPPGTLNEAHAETGQLYITPMECSTAYGITGVLEGQIRFAMDLINSACNRVSLWIETYEERAQLPTDRYQSQLVHRPVTEIIQARGRYGYSRRDRRTANQSNYDFIAATALFGNPPGFVPIDVNQIDIYGPTGEFWLPTGVFLVGFTEVEITYLAGYEQIPSRVKAATANVVNNICTRGASNRSEFTIGRSRERFSREGNAYIDDTTLSMLTPYISRTMV